MAAGNGVIGHPRHFGPPGKLDIHLRSFQQVYSTRCRYIPIVLKKETL